MTTLEIARHPAAACPNPGRQYSGLQSACCQQVIADRQQLRGYHASKLDELGDVVAHAVTWSSLWYTSIVSMYRYNHSYFTHIAFYQVYQALKKGIK